MPKHTGTCQHVAHPKDRQRREWMRASKAPIRQGGTLAPGYIEMEPSKATAEENGSVRPCLNCAVPKRGRMTAEEAKNWPKKGRSQMEQAFFQAFMAYSVQRNKRSVAEGRREWNEMSERLTTSGYSRVA